MQVNWQNIVRVRFNMLDSKCKNLLCSKFLESPDAIDAYTSWLNPLDCLCEYCILEAIDESNCAKSSILYEHVLKNAHYSEWVIDASQWLDALIKRISSNDSPLSRKPEETGESLALIRLCEVIMVSHHAKKFHGYKKSILISSNSLF
ncbi:hypothetical protein Ciccas_009787 [Cichlidogyrus casuarinus]|uniref:Uncharacterized protein n=1 Tax=Cichlidogyrus casuarinus TaxID=1844966 RepID=A0ABD2PXI4_9PLAT